MRLAPILIPTSCVAMGFNPLSPSIAQGPARALALRTPESCSILDFRTANAGALGRLSAIGLDPAPEEMLFPDEAIAAVVFDSPFASAFHLLHRTKTYPTTHTAAFTRDAVGFLADGYTPVCSPHPQRIALPMLQDAQWWPLIWLRPSTSVHEDLLRLARVRADLAALCAHSPLTCIDAQLGQPI